MSDDLRDRLAGALCPPHHRVGSACSGQPITALRPCQLHQAETDAVLAVVRPELDRLIAFLERGYEQHMRFGVLGDDGTVEMLRCADWCYRCKLEKAGAERDAALATLARVRELAEQWEREKDGGLAGALIFPTIAARLYRALAGPAGAGSTQDGA